MAEMSPEFRQNIVTLAKAFGKARGIKQATVSRMIRGDMYFLADYSRGAVSVTVKKYDEIIKWFESNWPEGHDMPKIKDHLSYGP